MKYRTIWICWGISLLFTLACMYVNLQYFRMEDMIKLEFASSAEEMHTYIMSAASSPASCYFILQWNTLIDYGFLISYSLLTFFSFRIFLDVFQLSATTWVYVLSFMTGMLDAIENYFLLTTANGQQEQFSAFYFWVVRIKWAFAIVPLLLIPMVIFYGLILLLRAKQ